MADLTLPVSVPTVTLIANFPTGFRNNPYPTQTITASGGGAPYTYSLFGGSLPPGLTLSASGVVSGTPTVVGPYSFTIRALASNGISGARTFSIDVVEITLGALPNGTVGASYTQTIKSAS